MTPSSIGSSRLRASIHFFLTLCCILSYDYSHAFSHFHFSRPRTSSVNAKAERAVDEQQRWYPKQQVVLEDDSKGQDYVDIADTEIEGRSVELTAELIVKRITEPNAPIAPQSASAIPSIIRGRFIDLTCEAQGERILENLFVGSDEEEDDVLLACTMILQSLCVLGMQVGLKGPPEMLARLVAHLDARILDEQDLQRWTHDSVRRLKYRQNRLPGLQLLARLKRKRTPQGAFDLLVAMGVWSKHEDLALLRSGFPLRFSSDELRVAREAVKESKDVDALLSIRKDLRKLKVYTIDSASTSEIDDGISLQEINGRHRILIHIADVERWSTPDLIDVARKRITSLYLPSSSYHMFPSEISTEVMSLRAQRDTCALTLAVELNEDGSINPETVIVAPSLIHVDYRLTYDEVDEMLEEGTGYQEEWELGALLDAAVKRREYRIRNGSTEGLIPNPIPYATISTFADRNAPDGIGISHNIQVSHNAGKNETALAERDDKGSSELLASPASSAYLLVTEIMILAGEAIGVWKCRLDETHESTGTDKKHANQVRLPFRTQPEPDFKSRARERAVMMDLLSYNVGGGLCHAWYSRRFLQSVKVMETQSPHSGLGLSCYVQWTSPIRRFTDLQVHISVKRYLRRQRVYQLMRDGLTIPDGVTDADLGFPFSTLRDGKLSDDWLAADELDEDINFLEGLGLFGAARTLQRQSQQYWMYEYIRRKYEKDPDLRYTAIVLGCVDPERQQYAIYVKELGLEHRYTSPGSRLDAGVQLSLKIDTVSPRFGFLTFVRTV